MIVFGTSSASKLKCFRNACSFFSLFTKAVGIRLSIFFNDSSFNLPDIFFLIFLVPAARVCQFSWLSFASQYTVGRKEYLFFFAMVQRHWKKKLTKTGEAVDKRILKCLKFQWITVSAVLGFDCYISIYCQCAHFFMMAVCPEIPKKFHHQNFVFENVRIYFRQRISVSILHQIVSYLADSLKMKGSSKLNVRKYFN